MLWGALAGALVFGPLIAFGATTTPLCGWVIWIYLAVVVWAMFLGFVFGNIRDKGSSDWDK